MDSHRNKHLRSFINCHCLLQVCPAPKPWTLCLCSWSQDMCWSHPRGWSRHSYTPVFQTRVPTPLVSPFPSVSPLTQVWAVARQALTGLVQRVLAAPACWDHTCFSSCPQHPHLTAAAGPNSFMSVSPAAGTSNLQHSCTWDNEISWKDS